MMHTRYQPKLVAGTVALLAALVWLTFRAGVPLYDGVGFPDEPYRFASPPPGSQQQGAPQGVEAKAKVSHATTQLLYITTSEQGPQAAVAIAAGTISASGNIRELTIRVQPVSPDSQPPDGTIAGNIYRILVKTDSGTITFKPHADSASYINLRGPQSSSTNSLTMEYRKPGGAWHQLSTSQVGADIYESPVVGFGDYALAGVSGAPKKTGPGVTIAFMVTILLTVAAIIGITRKKVADDRSNLSGA